MNLLTGNTYMQQLVFFALTLGIVAWLRIATITRPRSSPLKRWCTELAFGFVTALPLLI